MTSKYGIVEGQTFRFTERLYLTRAMGVTNDPAEGWKLLGGVGRTIPLQEAKDLGLVHEPPKKKRATSSSSTKRRKNTSDKGAK